MNARSASTTTAVTVVPSSDARIRAASHNGEATRTARSGVGTSAGLGDRGASVFFAHQSRHCRLSVLLRVVDDRRGSCGPPTVAGVLPVRPAPAVGASEVGRLVGGHGLTLAPVYTEVKRDDCACCGAWIEDDGTCGDCGCTA